MKRLLAIVLLGACGTTSVDSPDSPYGPGTGTPDDPVPQQSAKGLYQVRTTVDLTVEAILPQQAEAIVATLRDFSTNPGHSIITLADQEGVPAVKALYDALPSQLTDKFEGWVSDEVNKVSIGGVKVTTWAGQFAGVIDTAFSKFEVDSTLSIDGVSSTHDLTMLDFTPTGVLNVKIPISGFAQDILTQHPSIAVGDAGALTVGDQAFGLLFGQYAWDAVNNYCKDKYGDDIRGTIGKAVNCPKLAQDIANKCVLTVCVGHESLIEDICVGGLDTMVGALKTEFLSYNIEALHYWSGAAVMVDTDGDGIADRIDGGTWDAQMNIGLGLRHTPATWTATTSPTAVIQ